MVICTFFLNNTCRYGNQCKKEHIDVRLLIKTDIDTVIKGNQWLLSTYGPFKDRPSLTNFIVDQSFEEHRAAAYAAKTTGTFPAVAAQLAQSQADAKLRMQQLYELQPDTMQVLVQLYNSTEAGAGGGGGASGVGSNPNNPFSKVNAPSTANNAFGAKPNPFGSAASSQQASSSIFGSSAPAAQPAQSNPFAQSGNSLFGQPPVPAVASTNVFGVAATTSAANASSFFGGGNQPFGAPAQPVAAAASGGNIFAQPALSTAGGNSIFGGGAPTASTSVFGAAPAFGSNQAFGGGGGAAAAQLGGNIFGQAAAAAPALPTFGSAAAAPPANAFGGGGSIFGAPAAAAAPVATTNIFGDAAAQQQTNVFGAPAVAPAVAAPVAGGVFGSAPFGAPTTNTNVFGMPEQPQKASATQQSGGNVDVTVYSRMEELSESDVRAFGAAEFVLGAIPVRPPARQMC